MSTKPDKGHPQKPGTPAQPPKTPAPSAMPGPKPGAAKPATPPKR